LGNGAGADTAISGTSGETEMGWKEFFGFGKKKKEESGTLTDLGLKDLQVGYFVDYDLKTWEVVARHTYDWGQGDVTQEWQLKSADDTLYLERESDDEEEWSVSRPIPFARLGEAVRGHIRENEDPPEEIEYEGVTYYLDSFGGGQFFRNGEGPGRELLAWDYEDEEGDHYLAIEQWGEEEFEAAVGGPAESYQFTNILPRESSE
jgi:hypothetical protein